MNTAYVIVVAVLALVIIGAVLVLFASRRKRSERLHDEFGPEAPIVLCRSWAATSKPRLNWKNGRNVSRL